MDSVSSLEDLSEEAKSLGGHKQAIEDFAHEVARVDVSNLIFWHLREQYSFTVEARIKFYALDPEFPDKMREKFNDARPASTFYLLEWFLKYGYCTL